MYCPKCGKIVDEGVKFCPYCGESLVKSENKTFNNGSINKSSTTNKTSKTKKGGFLENTSTKRKCCYVFVILLILFLIVYIPYVIQYNINREDVSSSHQEELDALDLDGDGYLTFDEAKEYGNKTPESKLKEYFNIFDHNKKGLLKGDEWDTFRYAVYEYEHPKPKKKDKTKNSTSNSSFKSSSSSYTQNPDGDWEEVDEMVGYDSMGYPIYVSYYYTSGNLNMEPGVYRYVGNEYSEYDIEYVSSDWKHEYQGDW